MQQYDLIVIGAGPGGYVAAIRAAQLGLRVACIEREAALGGTCLRIGCIPSKALLEATERFYEAKHHLAGFGVKVTEPEIDLAKLYEHKDGVVRSLTQGVAHLFKKNKIDRYLGTGSFTAPDRVRVSGDTAQELSAPHIVIATGSTSTPLPGVAFDGDRIGTSTEALSYPEVPERLVVIGAGYIGLEMGSVWSRLGSEVTVLEYLDRILPGMDSEIAKEAKTTLARQGLRFELGTKVTGARVEGRRCIVSREGGDDIECDRVLLAVGRSPNTENLGVATIGLELDERKRIEVDDAFRTSVKGVYAIGDVIRGPMLAHKAEDEGIACVERIAKGYGHVNYDAIPGVVYTHPEIASVGKTEDELKEAGVAYKKGTFPFVANGRAKALRATQGRVKMLADERTDRVLGVHILGPRAGDLIAEAAAAIEFSATSEDIARTSHAHPTLAEVLREAAFATGGSAIHI